MMTNPQSQWTWKDHQTAALVNDLRDCAKEFAHTEQLRERISYIIGPLCDQLKDGQQALRARITELESQLEAIGAGGVEPLRKPAAAQQAVPASVIAGAVFDFAGYLTTLPHKEAIHCSEAHEAAPMVEAITEWCKRRNLTTDGAKVETWRDHLAEAPAHPTEGVPAAKNGRQVLVDSGALQMVLNALERDALEGKQVRAAMRLELMQSIANLPQPAAQGMEQDAARYRYLRETDRYFSDDKDGAIYVRQVGITSGVITGSTILTDEELDAAIDAALAAQAKQGEKP